MKYYELTDALARLARAQEARPTSPTLRALSARLQELDRYARAASPLRGDGLGRRLRAALAAEIKAVRGLYIAELALVRGGRIR